MSYKVTLKNITHRDAPQTAIEFAYTTALKNIVKGFTGSTWSRTHGCYYVANTKETCNQLYVYLKKHGVVMDYVHFKVHGTAAPIAIPAPVAVPAPVPIAVPVVKKVGYSPADVALLTVYTNLLEGKRHSASTIDTYLNLVKPFILFIQGKPIAAVTGDDVRLYIEQIVKKKGYSISTHRQLVSALKLLLALYKNDQELSLIERPKKSTYRPAVLNNNEIIELLRVTTNLKHRCILALIYSCGLRIGELLALEIKHVDLERKQLHIVNGKGRKDRYVGMATGIMPLLLNYIDSFKPTKYFIEGAAGTMYSASSIRAFLKRSCTAARITKTVTPHTLRHSYATHLVENGTGIAHIQRLLGHAKPETTMLYTHIANVDLINIENPLDVAIQKKRAWDKESENMRLSGK